MHHSSTRPARLKSVQLAAALAAAALLGACGGGEGTPEGPTMTAQKGGDCIGSCTGGGGTPVPGAVNPLPTTAPAPGYLVRESFGPGPEQLRPKGGKGDMRSAFLHTTIGGFWVEWPGSKDTQWITASGDQSWKFAGAGPNPYELPSPLQTGPYGYEGVAYSEVFDVTTPVYPAALLPVKLPTTPWALSIEGYPQGLAGFASYIALGLTDSSATLSNLSSSSRVALMLKRLNNETPTWELWLGGSPRRLVASGLLDDLTWNHLELAYDPATKLLKASVNGVLVGSATVDLNGARYAGFEGLGLVDNFVLRSLP